jgi:hypothetical protein
MKFQDYISESAAISKIDQAETAAQKLFTFLTTLVDIIEKEIMEKEGRKIQIQSQKVKIKSVERDLRSITENLKRFAKRA